MPRTCPRLVHTFRRTALGPQDASTSSPLGGFRVGAVERWRLVALALGLARELDAIGVVHDAVEDRVGDRGLGEAIVTWLCNARKGNSRHLFVCVRPPYTPFTSSKPVRSALGKAYRRAGLVAPGGRTRTHALRHGLAMALLDRGSSLAEIGDVLRHRCARSTTAYARYDHGALRALARPWPVPGEER